jgi:hypothetical protein
MSVILRPDFPEVKRIPISGATASDIDRVSYSVDLIFNLAISALQGQLENLRENLPMSSLNNFDDLYRFMHDLRSDTLGRLERLAEDR